LEFDNKNVYHTQISDLVHTSVSGITLIGYIFA